MATTGAPVEYQTAAAAEEKAKLQKHFSRFDIYFFLICTIVGVDTLGQVASNGAQGLTWLLVLAVLFFVPYAFLTAELGAAFTEEGGCYVWTKLAIGRFVACINAVFYWFSNPVWIGGSLVLLTLTAVNTYFFNISTGGILWYIVGLGYIWFSVWSAILSFGIGKWIPTIGAWVRVLLLSVFTLTVIAYAAKNGVHGVSAGEFKPTWPIFFGLVPVLFFNFVGFELPSAAGDEMKDPQKDVPVTIRRAWLVAILAYGLPILAILLVIPKDQITGLGGFIDAIKTVFTVFGGHLDTAADGTVTPVLTGFGTIMGGIAAIGFILALLSSGATWIMGADRSQAVAAYDGAGPRMLGTFSGKYGTPIAVNYLSGILSTVVLVLATVLTSGDTAKYFTAVLGLAISTTTLSYLGIFPALYLLRRKYPEVERPYSAPGGMLGAGLISGLCLLWALIASINLIFPGAFNVFTGTPADDALVGGGFEGQRFAYEASQLIPLIAIIALGIAFYAMGAKTRAQQVDVPLD